MKNKELIMGFVGVFLVLAIVFGMVVALNYDFDDTAGKQQSNTPQTPTTSPGVDADEKYAFASMYSDTNLGYVAKGNETIFFVAVSAPELIDDEGCSDKWSLHFDKYYRYIQSNIFDGSTDNPLKYSIDGGETWHDFFYDDETSVFLMCDEAGKQIYVSNRQEIFVAFAEKTNCADVDAVFEAWLSDQFNNLEPVESSCCGGVYNAYDTFIYDACHKAASNGGIVG